MDPSSSALIFDDLMHGQRRTPTLYPEYKRCWKVWPEQHISHYGLQKWILAGLYGLGVTAVHCLHSRQSRIL